MIELQSVRSGYGAGQVLFDVDLKAESNGVTCILGHNGAGKTTLLRTIMGTVSAMSGAIRFNGRNLIGSRPFQIARAGIGYVPEDRRVFAELTVQENLDVAARSTGGRDHWTTDRVYALFPVLHEFRARVAGRLSGGQQQMLAIARALVGNPELLLLDEPTEGLSPVVVHALESHIIELNKSGLTILLACQDIGFALRAADWIYVMERGKITFYETAANARADPTKLKNEMAL